MKLSAFTISCAAMLGSTAAFAPALVQTRCVAMDIPALSPFFLVALGPLSAVVTIVVSCRAVSCRGGPSCFLAPTSVYRTD